MTREMIASILDAEGIKAGAKGVYSIPEEREAACLVGAAGEVITIAKLAKIDVGPHAIALETTKHERVYFAYEAVVGLRFTVASKERSTGFKT